MRLQISTLSLLLNMLFFSTVSSAQTAVDLKEYGCKTIAIEYDENGTTEKGILLFIRHKEPDLPLYFTHVYLLNKYGNKVLVNSGEELAGVNQVLVSEDNKYLAISQVAEGHPWVDVYDLELLLREQKLKAVGQLNPYPGVIHLMNWKGIKLVVKADINMLLLNDNRTLTLEDSFEEDRMYYYDVINKKYEEGKIGK